jgi:hypothetical protein
MALTTQLLHFYDLQGASDLDDKYGTNDLSTFSGTPDTLVGGGPNGQDVVDLTDNNDILRTASTIAWSQFPQALGLTVSFWVRVNSKGVTTNRLVGDFDAGTRDGCFQCRAPGPGTSFFSRMVGQDSTIPNPGERTIDLGPIGTLVLGEWYHFVATCGDTLAKLYINNSLLASDDSSTFTLGDDSGVPNPFYVGGDPDWTTLNQSRSYFMAVGIWERILQEEEISTLYNSGNGLLFSEFPVDISETPVVLPHDPQPFLDELADKRGCFSGGSPFSSQMVELNGGSLIEMTAFEPDPVTFRDEYYYHTVRNVLYKKIVNYVDGFRTAFWQKVSI